MLNKVSQAESTSDIRSRSTVHLDANNPAPYSKARISSHANSTGRPIRVLHILQSIRYGGIETCLLNWMKYSDPSQVEMHAACFVNDRNREDQFQNAARLRDIPTIGIPWGIHKPFFSAARAAAKIADELDIDVIHGHGYYADVVSVLASRKCRAKTVLTVYVWGGYSIRRQWSVLLDKIAVKYADKVTAHCDYTAEVMKNNGVPSERIDTLIAGFPHDHVVANDQKRSNIRQQLGLNSDGPIVLNAARMQKEKAHDHLLHAFFLARQTFPDAKLLIAGVGWKRRERELRELTTRLGLDDSVTYLGFIDDLWPYFDAADLVVQPSHIEGVPLTFLQAMAAGRPIICYDVGGVREIVKHEETGIVVPHNNIDQLAESMTHLLANRDVSTKLGLNAANYVNNEYSIERAVSDLTSAYQQVVDT